MFPKDLSGYHVVKTEGARSAQRLFESPKQEMFSGWGRVVSVKGGVSSTGQYQSHEPHVAHKHLKCG